MSETEGTVLSPATEGTPTTTPPAGTTPPTEPSTSSGAPTTEPSKVEEPPKPTGAPEAYTDFTAPEGVKLDADAVKTYTEEFKKAGLTQDQAQAVVNMAATREQGLITKAQEQYNATREGWRNEVKAEYGSKLQSEMLPTVAKALDGFPPEVRQSFNEAMNLTGAGDNPAFVKVFYGLAKQLVEGGGVRGNPPTPKPTNPGFGGSLYPEGPRTGSGAPS